MGYNKFIKYGNTFELYEYEREPVAIQRRPRGRSAHAGTAGVRADRKDTLSPEQLGKRRDNAQRARVVFRRLVAANLGGSERPLLLTLTYKENCTDIKIGYKHYRSFVQALRHKYGKVFRYICVPEFQKRGAVHFHALVWGLPASVVLQERKTRTIARLWGHGFIFLRETDGHEKLSSYLAKYMSKAFVDMQLKNQKAYVASRNIKRPVIGKGFSPIWPILDDYVGEDNPPVKVKEYHTKWLGKCVHRTFKIDD